MVQKCPDCEQPLVIQNRGNGRCSNCHGSGTLNTIVNDISGVDTKCWKCKGNGQCPTCGGTGRVESSVKVPVLDPLPPELPISDLEKAWYRLCDTSTFISDDRLQYFMSRLNAAGLQGAIVVGLSKFTGQTCGKCGEHGQFKIRFLGRLEHLSCGHQWYLGPGTYIGFQLQQILHTGMRASVAAKDNASRKGDRTGALANGIFAFFFATVFRAVAAVALIPLHCIVALFQPNQSQSERVIRGITLGVVLIALGVGIYAIQQATR